jgi:hypothetical protein
MASTTEASTPEALTRLTRRPQQQAPQPLCCPEAPCLPAPAPPGRRPAPSSVRRSCRVSSATSSTSAPSAATRTPSSVCSPIETSRPGRASVGSHWTAAAHRESDAASGPLGSSRTPAGLLAELNRSRRAGSLATGGSPVGHRTLAAGFWRSAEPPSADCMSDRGMPPHPSDRALGPDSPAECHPRATLDTLQANLVDQGAKQPQSPASATQPVAGR